MPRNAEACWPDELRSLRAALRPIAGMLEHWLAHRPPEPIYSQIVAARDTLARVPATGTDFIVVEYQDSPFGVINIDVLEALRTIADIAPMTPNAAMAGALAALVSSFITKVVIVLSAVYRGEPSLRSTSAALAERHEAVLRGQPVRLEHVEQLLITAHAGFSDIDEPLVTRYMALIGWVLARSEAV